MLETRRKRGRLMLHASDINIFFNEKERGSIKSDAIIEMTLNANHRVCEVSGEKMYSEKDIMSYIAGLKGYKQ